MTRMRLIRLEQAFGALEIVQALALRWPVLRSLGALVARSPVQPRFVLRLALEVSLAPPKRKSVPTKKPVAELDAGP
jgi:hypothetical protein